MDVAINGRGAGREAKVPSRTDFGHSFKQDPLAPPLLKIDGMDNGAGTVARSSSG